MNNSLESIAGYLKNRLELPLPGQAAHEPMRPTPKGGVRPLFRHSNPPKPGSVLILLYEQNGIVRFPLIKRPAYTGIHGGQISLPGGKSEGEESPIETALREAEEEVGIGRRTVETLGFLSRFHVIPSNYLVTPVIARLKGEPLFVPDPHEVERVLTCPIEQLLRQETLKEKEILVAGQYLMMAPHFEIEREVVWGATGMILNEFKVVLNEMVDLGGR